MQEKSVYAPTKKTTLPGPILNRWHRRLAAHRIARHLKALANGDPADPATWRDVAARLGIGFSPFNKIRGFAGRLVYVSAYDRWIIEYNEAFSPYRQSCILVHELAHWLQRTMTAEALCDEPVVYYYSGSVDDERHEIARVVEGLVVGLWCYFATR